MANSRFEYVKNFERDDRLLPETIIVVRIDGKGFHKFTQQHSYERPNDLRGIGLMNLCAKFVIEQFPDILLAYGQSDEYSFVFKKSTTLYNRREFKLTSSVASCFAGRFVYHWPEFFPDSRLRYPPTFDSRSVCYPNLKCLKDYLAWRQADCHVNNLYNTTFWALVQDANPPMSNADAQNLLKDTYAKDKNEILYSHFGVNYAKLPEVFRKGTVILNEHKKYKLLVEAHVDMINREFWDERPWLYSALT